MSHSYYSHKGTIIRWFQDMGIPLKVSFFQRWRYFVGYKANSRIDELITDEGILERLPIDEIGSKWQHFALYQLTEAWQDYKVPKPTLVERFKHLFS